MKFFDTIRSRGFLPLLLCALMALAAGSAYAAANIVIINNDGAGEGFNDPTPVAPVGGNPGVTLGQQRLNVFHHAASIWGAILTSTVTIEVRAQFNPQTCNATSAVLGSAGPLSIHRDFAGAPFAGTQYHAALANKLNGSDLSANPDINATFNSQIDAGCFGPGIVWYYGFDGLEGANIELLPVVLHELGHGLGSSTTTSGSTGNFNGGFPHIWDRFLMDNTLGLHWNQMSAAQRVASAISIDHLVWDGPNVTGEAASYLGPRPQMFINSPGGIAGTYAAQSASFGAALTLAGVTGNVVLADDAMGTDVNDGCEPLVNGAAINGNIALINRGTCTFVLKAQAAQAAGAIALLITNNVAAGLPGMGGSDPSITIPCIGITQADGNAIKANLGGGVNVTIGLNPAALAGADAAGRVFMYAPNPFAGGSSVSHFDVSLSPNALMEPAINNSLHNTVDLTHGQFVDIGWFTDTVPVLLADFLAEGTDDGILLRWRFSDPSEVGSVTLERATAAVGPWSPMQTELGSENGLTTALDRSVELGETYWYRLKTMDRSGQMEYVGLVSAQRAGLSTRVHLGPARPNPSRGTSSVLLRLGSSQTVALDVLDVSGRKVRTLQSGVLAAGDHDTTWDGRTDLATDAPSGIYFIRLKATQGVKTQRIVLLR